MYDYDSMNDIMIWFDDVFCLSLFARQSFAVANLAIKISWCGGWLFPKNQWDDLVITKYCLHYLQFIWVVTWWTCPFVQLDLSGSNASQLLTLECLLRLLTLLYLTECCWDVHELILPLAHHENPNQLAISLSMGHNVPLTCAFLEGHFHCWTKLWKIQGSSWYSCLKIN